MEIVYTIKNENKVINPQDSLIVAFETNENMNEDNVYELLI